MAFFSGAHCLSDWPDLQPLIIRSLLAPINSVGPELCFSMVRAMMRKDRYSMKDLAFFNEIFIKFNRDFVPAMLKAVAEKLKRLAPFAAADAGAGAGAGAGR